MKTSMFLASLIGLLTCSPLVAQTEADKKRDAVEKKFSAVQKKLFAEYLDLQVRREARYFDPAQGIPLRPLPKIRADTLDFIDRMPAENAKAFWRDLPHDLKRGFRDLNPLHISAEERKAADGLPAAVKEEVAKMMSDDLDVVLAARRKVIAYGPACRALVVDQAVNLPANSVKRLRNEDLLAKLNFEEIHDRRMRVTETALQKAAKLEKDRKKPTSTLAVLTARGMCDLGQRNDPYGKMCYYNFIHSNSDYKAGVGLEFGNGQGNQLGINFYGGQDSRMTDLGKVKYGEIKKAPNSDTTTKWWRDRSTGEMIAEVGHVYLLHIVEPRDNVDFAVKLRVLDRSYDEWIIIEWERIPQEK